MYDTRLVVAAQEGDDAAFAALYDRNAEAVYDFCWALAGDEREASRMVEDAFVLAARHIDDVTDASQVRPWVLAIVRDRALAEDEVGEFETGWGTRPAVGTGVDVLPVGDLRRWAREAAATLALADQAVLELAARNELDGDQLACAIGCDPSQLDTVVAQVDQEADEVLGALVVARQGRRDCPELATLLEAWDGAPAVDVAEQTSAHIPGCERCSRRAALIEPRKLVAAAPRAALPTALRAAVLDAVGPELAAAAARRAGGEPSPAALALEAAAEEDAALGAPTVVGAAVIGAAAGGAGGAASGGPGAGGAASGGAGAGGGGGGGGSAAGAVVAAAAVGAAAAAAAGPLTAPAAAGGTPDRTAAVAMTGPAGAPGGPAGAPPGPPPPGKDGPPWMVIVAAALAVAVLIAIVALAVRGSPKSSLSAAVATTVPASPASTAASTAAPAPTLAPVDTSTTGVTTSTVPAGGHLQLDSGAVDLGAASASAPVLLSNSGPGPVAWRANVGPAWLSVSPSAGTLRAGASQNITVTVDRAKVPPGTFSVQVGFVATGNGSVGAVLTVSGSQTASTTTTSGATSTTAPGGTSTTAPSPTSTTAP